MHSRPLLLAATLVACEQRHAATAGSSTGTVGPRQVDQPRFEAYAVPDTALRRLQPAPVDFASAAYGGMYRTRLRDGAAAGPNFAGHHTVVLWGCGTGCQVVAVVDARTGQLSHETLLTAGGVQYRRDSRLLFADAPTPEQPPDCASCGTPAFYEWRDGRFVPVGAGPHPHLGGRRPWRTKCAPSDSAPAAATGLYTCPQSGTRRGSSPMSTSEARHPGRAERREGALLGHRPDMVST
jgi:hypothetical protein